jgi:hypothetical protein
MRGRLIEIVPWQVMAGWHLFRLLMKGKIERELDGVGLGSAYAVDLMLN